jgi:predicted nucleic acid-binding protein
MHFLLDTNVLSELVKPMPATQVVRWVEAQSPMDLCISVLTLGELTRGIELLVPGKRRSALTTWVGKELGRQFVGRVVAVDAAVAAEWGRLSAAGKTAGRDLPVIDGLLLATASIHGLTLVTRNEADCADRGVPVLNPWGAAG